MVYRWVWLQLTPPSEQKPWLVTAGIVVAGVTTVAGRLVACTAENAGLAIGLLTLLAGMEKMN